MKYTPRPYQTRAYRTMMANQHLAGLIDMGLGKTVVTLSAIGNLIGGLDIRAALIVAPIRVVEDVWPVEIAKWEHTRWLKHSIIRGLPSSRTIVRRDKMLDEEITVESKVRDSTLEALAPGADIYLANYEILPELCNWASEQDDLPWDMLIFDESSKMKSAKARRFKMIKPMLARMSRRVILTGTPRPNSYMDLWSQMYLVDQGERLGKYVTHYRDRFFNYNPYKYETTLKDGAGEQIMDHIKDVSIVMQSDDYLSLPPVINNVVTVTLPPKARAVYEQMEREMLASLANGVDVELQTAATLSMACRQVTSGALYHPRVDGGPRNWDILHDAKIKALEDIIDEASGEPVMVAYEFKHEIAALLKRWPKAQWIGSGSKDPSGVIAKWNKRSIPLLFVHPASVGHGCNLQFGGRILVWTSMTWSCELDEQTVKRLHRSGQDRPVIVHRLVCKDTVDEVVLATLRTKGTDQKAMLTALATRGL